MPLSQILKICIKQRVCTVCESDVCRTLYPSLGVMHRGEEQHYELSIFIVQLSFV